MRHRILWGGVSLLLLIPVGCADPSAAGRSQPAPSAAAAATPSAAAAPGPAAGPLVPVTRVHLDANLALETERDPAYGLTETVGPALRQALLNSTLAGLAPVPSPPTVVWMPKREGSPRRVVIQGTIAVRRGFLEHLLSYPFKAHESIIVSQFDARLLHFALEAIGLKAGRPVQFVNGKQEEEFSPPRGDPVKITVRYVQDGRTVEVPAQRWVRYTKTKKELDQTWVFAGSHLFPNPEDAKKPYYGANDGRVICTTNFTTALLDLPIQSADRDPNEGLDFEANTDLIPPRDTPVTVLLEPQPPTAAKK
jgi:hypothetical protein